MTIKKRTYKDWWTGEVTLVYAPTIYDEGKKPTTVNWDAFRPSIRTKIQSKQEEIFWNRCGELLKKYKVNFEKQFKASQIPGQLLYDERKQAHDVMFAPIPNASIITLNHWEFSFESNDLMEIQRYIKRTIKKGVNDGFAHIHSPNNQFQNDNKIPSQIYAQVIWDYYQWLHTDFEIVEPNEQKEKPGSENERRLWFQVGLLFANGKMEKICLEQADNLTPNFSQIARDLGNPSFRPYISESYNNSTSSDKNIFSSKKKLTAILDYCRENNITVIKSFESKANPVLS